MRFDTGSTKHPLYLMWAQMRYRCRNRNAVNFYRYGGRGIASDPMWEHFWTFVFDMAPRPSPQHTIDRIDNSGPYAPWNCRWATQREQSRNMRSNVLITFNGITQCIKDWALHFKVDQSTIVRRVQKYGASRAFAKSVPSPGHRRTI